MRLTPLFISMLFMNCSDDLGINAEHYKLTEHKLYPSSLTVVKGSVSGQSITVLSTLEQYGSDDDWSTYIEHYPPKNKIWKGYYYFDVPSEVDLQDLDEINFAVNFKGPMQSWQRWYWSWYNFDTDAWVYIGDNTESDGWIWEVFEFVIQCQNGACVDSNRKIKIMFYGDKRQHDQCDIDFMELAFSTNGEPPPPPPPPPNWWQPTPGNSWQIQFVGDIDYDLPGVEVYDISMFSTPAATIADMHSRSDKVICYISAGTLEDWRPDYNDFPPSVVGNPVSGWPGEYWLDISNLAVLQPLMEARAQLAADKGCDAIDWDNVDGYTYSNTGFTLTYQNQIDYNLMLANAAHSRGMAAGLKNDLEQIGDLIDNFDFAINEGCFDWNECDMLDPFITANKPVFQITYSMETYQFCPEANSKNFDALKKNWNLDLYREPCR